MTRNDGILYAGSSSNAYEERLKKLKARKLERHKKQRTLSTAEDIVIKMIDQERESVKLDLLKLVNINTSEKQTKELLVSLNLYDESMKKLKTRFNNILRLRETDKETTNE